MSRRYKINQKCFRLAQDERARPSSRKPPCVAGLTADPIALVCCWSRYCNLVLSCSRSSVKPCRCWTVACTSPARRQPITAARPSLGQSGGAALMQRDGSHCAALYCHVASPTAAHLLVWAVFRVGGLIHFLVWREHGPLSSCG